MERIQIKCPVCGVVLAAKDNPDNANKFVTCPNCHERRRFFEFNKIAPIIEAIPSNLFGDKKLDDNTELTIKKDVSPGCLFDILTGISYPLHEGQALVGRKPQSSPPKADIPIVTTDRGMSRSHMIVRVTLAQDGRYHV